jgi:hypothetical protein
MITLENGRRQFHIYKCICTTSKLINNPVYSKGRMIEIRHPDNDPNFLAKTQEFKDTHPKICRGYHIKLLFDRFPTSL